MLTHYTQSVEAIVNILAHGFAWVPNRRRLTKLLIPQHDYTKREPQQFGMISFTELDPPNANVHRGQFGEFGIVVSEAWAVENGAQRVIYIERHGPVTAALQMLFTIGYEDVTRSIEYPDDEGWLMAYENKNVASSIARSTMWAHLLQLWEYLEPASSSQQHEWRIVNTMPLYGLSENKDEAIAQVSPPQNWAKYTHALPIHQSDVVAVICELCDIGHLQDALPDVYNDVDIIQING